MDEKIKSHLDRLVSIGKITEEERKELEEAIFSGQKTGVHRLSEGIHTVRIKGLTSCDVRVAQGEEREVKIVKGGAFFAIREEKGAVEIVPIAEEKSFLNRIFSSHRELSILIPENVNVEIKVVSGDIAVSHLKGDISAKSVSGDITVNGASGRINLISLSGDINCKETKGSIYAEVKSGDINMSYCKLNGSLKTYSGDIAISQSEVQSLTLVSYSGDISVVDSLVHGELSAKAVFGDIRLKLKENHYNITAETAFGDINTHGGDFKKEHSGYSSKAVLKGGGVPVNVMSKKGDISINII